MADLVPVSPGPGVPATLEGGGALSRLRSLTAQPAVRMALPWFGGIAALGGTALLWATLSPAPQRTLYGQLGDAEKANVAAALDKAAIAYQIDNGTGAITVGEDDLYRARMLVASDGAVAAPQSGEQMLDAMPMGASRTMENERVRSARERDIQLTIMEIDGVESVRVHLGEAEKSVFVRDNVAPSASVMVKLAQGRQLAQSQVEAIRNLVAASIPGLSIDAVKVVDQAGRLLSAGTNGDNDSFDLQSRMEDKLRRQVSQLLTPMLGEGNFSSEIQIDLDMDEVTSARESYDKQGVIRSETNQASQTAAGTGAVGVPGVLSNTPPPPTTAQPGAPQGTPAAATAPGAAPTNGESSATRNYELGREVQVSNITPGKIRRLTVAVALSTEAMKQAKAADIQQIKQLVSAAVGANPQRGDQVEVITRSFQPETVVEQPMWETQWFLSIVRNVVALLAVILVLLLGVRPLIKALRREPAPVPEPSEDSEAEAAVVTSINPQTGAVDPAMLGRQVGLAQRLVAEQPESAVIALRQMLNQPGAAPAGQAAA